MYCENELLLSRSNFLGPKPWKILLGVLIKGRHCMTNLTTFHNKGDQERIFFMINGKNLNRQSNPSRVWLGFLALAAIILRLKMSYIYISRQAPGTQHHIFTSGGHFQNLYNLLHAPPLIDPLDAPVLLCLLKTTKYSSHAMGK